MLYDFRTPRIRPWTASYMKKLKSLLLKKEETSHIFEFFDKANEHRQQLQPILDDCAKNNRHRPEDIIQVLNNYIPLVETIVESITALVIDLKSAKFDLVWTSFLTIDVNFKSLSHSMKFERLFAYSLLGLSHYQHALKIHRENRIDAAAKKKAMPRAPAYDPLTDERSAAAVAAEEEKSPVILDDTEMVKEITKELKISASIWHFCASELHPVDFVATAYQSIPETFRDMHEALSMVALANAQEFMVQLAVQTKKSALITSMLAAGVSMKLDQTAKLLKGSLPSEIHGTLDSDLTSYLSMRSILYNAISLKYYGLHTLNKSEFGKCLIYFRTAKSLCETVSFPVPAKKKGGLSPQLSQIKSSLAKQAASVVAMSAEAEKDNSTVYFEPVPKSIDDVPKPEPAFKMAAEPFTPLKS